MKTKTPVIRMRRSGTVYILVTVVMGVLAINGGNNIHYLTAAMMLGYMLASGVIGRRNLKAAVVSMEVPDEIYAGEPFLLAVELRNCNRRVPIFLLHVRMGMHTVFFPMIRAGEAATKTLFYALPSRGRHEMGELELSSVYPFNFFTRYSVFRYDGTALVFPAPVDDILPGTRYAEGDAENAASEPSKLDSESDVVGVRPYVEGDSMRRVHWKSSARTGRLNSRIYDNDAGGAGKIVDLDALLERGVERGLSVASHEIREALRSGEAIGMLDGACLYPPSAARGDKLKMLEGLALHG